MQSHLSVIRPRVPRESPCSLPIAASPSMPRAVLWSRKGAVIAGGRCANRHDRSKADERQEVHTTATPRRAHRRSTTGMPCRLLREQRANASLSPVDVRRRSESRRRTGCKRGNRSRSSMWPRAVALGQPRATHRADDQPQSSRPCILDHLDRGKHRRYPRRPAKPQARPRGAYREEPCLRDAPQAGRPDLPVRASKPSPRTSRDGPVAPRGQRPQPHAHRSLRRGSTRTSPTMRRIKPLVGWVWFWVRRGTCDGTRATSCSRRNTPSATRGTPRRCLRSPVRNRDHPTPPPNEHLAPTLHLVQSRASPRELRVRILLDRRVDESAAQSIVRIRIPANQLRNGRILDSRRNPRHRSELHDIGGLRVTRGRDPQMSPPVVGPVPKLEHGGKRQPSLRDVVCTCEWRHVVKLDRAP